MISLEWSRTEKKKNKNRNNLSLEERMFWLENELERVVTVLVDTTDLAELNRENLLALLRKLKEHKQV